MSDCGVCIGGYDSDGPELCNSSVVKARKPHICCECRQEISKGSEYEKITGKWDGSFGQFDTCLTCANIRDKFACDGGLGFGQLWDEMYNEAFPYFTIGCLEGLTVAAKQKVMDEWRNWKGLANA